MNSPNQKMLYYEHAWPESFDTCPPDRDFVEWLEVTNQRDEVIFHMGTGLHHYVGRNIPANRRLSVIGLTASRGEMDAYEEQVIEEPKIAQNYQCIFGDIYLFNPALLPALNIATLFHLCEFTDERRKEYGGCSDREVIQRVMSALTRHVFTDRRGLIVFYKGSMAFPKVEPIIKELTDRGALKLHAEYKSLVVYESKDW